MSSQLSLLPSCHLFRSEIWPAVKLCDGLPQISTTEKHAGEAVTMNPEFVDCPMCLELA